MIATVTAIRAALTAAGVANHFVDVPDDATYPYALLWLGSGVPPVEDAVAPVGDVEDVLGVTAVAESPEGVLVVRRNVRAALAGFAPSTAVAGRLVWLSVFDSRPVLRDKDITSRRVFYGVDSFRLVSTPA